MLKSLLISGAVITGAAVVACVAYLGKKAVNTLEEVLTCTKNYGRSGQNRGQ